LPVNDGIPFSYEISGVTYTTNVLNNQSLISEILLLSDFDSNFFRTGGCVVATLICYGNYYIISNSGVFVDSITYDNGETYYVGSYCSPHIGCGLRL